MVRITRDYGAGILTGVGVALFFLALGVQSNILNSGILEHRGALFAGLAFILGGGGILLRRPSARAES
jgi:hypothetical protein